MNNTSNAVDIKRALALAIQQKDLDYNEILFLANEIAKLDTDNIRFSVDASHISRLGIELVSKQETAVAELIKNAYDADALSVDMIFKGSDVKGGTLEIIDNGHGMSREQLLNGFMRISTQDKVLSPVSLKYGRQKAGRKGIGRFATQRLGKRLHIISQLESADHALELEIDWESFEGGKELYLISNQFKILPRQSTSGTILRIIDLRDAWTEAQIQRAFRYVSELLQPFPLDRSKADCKPKDPGFKVTFYRGQEEGELVEVASEEQSIYAHSIAQFSGEIDGEGIPYIGILSEKYNINIETRPLEFEPRLKPKTGLFQHNYPLLSGIKFKAHYFIEEELPSGTRTMVRDFLRNHGGIRVYRNGFRVLPYGEAFDDWLGLQRSSALRALLPPHHNNNFLGLVEITDITGKRFEETASREGLLENEAFLQLQDFVYRGLLAGVMKLAHARKKKIFASDEKPGESSSSNKKGPRDTASSVADRIRSMAGSLPQSSGKTATDTSHPSDVEGLAEEIEALGVESQEILEENGMLRVLASLGLTIGEFTHEVRHAIAALNVTISKVAEEGVSQDSLAAVRDNMTLLQSYVRYFDNAITQNAHRKLDVHELRDLVNDFSEMIRPTLTRQNIELTTRFNGYDLFTKPMHKSEWASVLLNLFTNSVKAIHRANVNGRISIIAGTVDDRLFIEFADNGDGILAENKEKIFDAFFTTSSPPSVLVSDTEKLVGTGLGLKIVRDIIDAANGEITPVDPPATYTTCFRIEVPKAKEEEIGDARY
ncbi:MAG: sensor histidine kinase [Methylobacter sp.]